MKRTHYTIKAQRARKAWKRLKKQTLPKTTIVKEPSGDLIFDRSFTELV